jgi:hypothetical protein
MTVIGLDLNATRARAVQGPTSQLPAVLPLVGSQRELPLAISLEERQPLVGRPGAALCRKLPHLACVDFLPWLGDGRQWIAGWHRLDATRALGLVFEHLARICTRTEGAALAIPGYLTREQAALISPLADKARWRALGVSPMPVLAALAAQEDLPWSGLVVVVDVDGHALNWSAVGINNDHARLLQTHLAPALNLSIWLVRLLNGVAQRCIRVSRRDPRASAEGEQDLYDQLARLLGVFHEDEPVSLTVQTPHWYQHLTFNPAELVEWCRPLVVHAVAETSAFLAGLAAAGPIGAVLLTDAAGRLPGLAAALEGLLQQQTQPVEPPRDDTDFGEDLLGAVEVRATHLRLLDADAMARAAHELALRIHRGELPRGFHDDLPLAAGKGQDDQGPARLHFRGKDYLLSGELFTLGRDPDSSLVFESELYPTVSARHCEIVFDRHVYCLRDRSRHGTLVNDCVVTQQVVLHSGDWIRLGPSGPVLRFLGASSGRARLMTTA